GDDVEETAKEHHRTFAGALADDGAEDEARAVIDEEEDDTAQAACAGSEVLSVDDEHLHAVRVREAAHVGLALGRDLAERDSEGAERAPGGDAIALVFRDEEAMLHGAAESRAASPAFRRPYVPTTDCTLGLLGERARHEPSWRSTQKLHCRSRHAAPAT